jgi:membrane-bound ClpP family serine protease
MFKKFVIIAIMGLCCASFVSADTFTEKKTGKVYHGYAINKKINSHTMVKTVEAGFVQLKLSTWEAAYDANGRENLVVVIPLDKEISFDAQVDATGKSLDLAVSKGPQFIIIEVDTAGGRMDISRQLAALISKADNFTPVYAYIKSENTKGAINAGIFPALACRKIYINPDACIGGTDEKNDPNDNLRFEYVDVRKMFGDTVGEKFSSAIRAYAGTLAQQNEKPELIAMAMVDKNIDVIEVDSSEKPLKIFVDTANKTDEQKQVKIWSDTGNLLLLDSAGAMETQLADGTADSIEDMIEQLTNKNIPVERIDTHLAIKKKLDAQTDKINEFVKKIEQLNKDLKTADSREKKGITLQLIKQYNSVLGIARTTPELGLNISYMKMSVDGLQMDYDSMK